MGSGHKGYGHGDGLSRGHGGGHERAQDLGRGGGHDDRDRGREHDPGRGGARAGPRAHRRQAWRRGPVLGGGWVSSQA